MKVKFGAIVTEGRGKLGGHVASRNSGGAYFRTRVTPVNPQTSLQQSYRAVFGSISRSWRSLSESAREAWNNAVSNWSKTDVFGDVKNPSGFNLHQKLNMIMNTISQPFLTLPPDPADVPPVSLSSINYLPGQIDLNLVSASGPLTSDTILVVEATPPVSPGKKFVANLMRVVTTIEGNAVFLGPGNDGVLEISDFYTERFGAYESMIGKKIYVNVRTVDAGSGSRSVAFGDSFVIA
jgi:hypothetical protein